MPPWRVAALALCLACWPSAPLWAGSLLGSAQHFAVLGHSAVTNAHVAPNPITRVYGDVGVAPGGAITGIDAGLQLQGGNLHSNNATAQAARADVQLAWAALVDLPGTVDLSGAALGSPGFTVLTPGVYSFSTAAVLTGPLVLDFAGDAQARFVFQVGSSLTTAAGSSVQVLNGGPDSSVYWRVGSSATVGADSRFAGNILAGASVTLGARAQIVCGRAFALGGAVTLIDNAISTNCAAQNFGDAGRSDFGSLGFSGQATAVPEPGTAALWGLGLLALAGAGQMCSPGRQPSPARPGLA